MDSVDVLGPRPERREVFTRELLAETDDTELQEIVETAARDLSTPIALVSLVLDQIQFFKAHYGLPPDLAAARATRRDVSFCQFVVRDGEAFEVEDAPKDARIPQHLVKTYDIRSYLGIPVRVRDTVVGSLCVLDTKARRFSDADRASLARLAALVNERVTALTESRHRTRIALTERATAPALVELRQSLAPIPGLVGAGLPAVTAIRAFLRLSAHVLEGGSTPPDVIRRSLGAAHEAAEASEEALHDIAAAAADCGDCVVALEHLMTPSPSTRLSDVATAAQDLARQATRPVGGVPLPDLSFDPLVYAPRPLAVALLATTLTALAARLASLGESGGIEMRLRDLGPTAELALSAPGLSDAVIEEVASELGDPIGTDPTVAIDGAGGALRLTFRILPPEGGAPG